MNKKRTFVSFMLALLAMLFVFNGCSNLIDSLDESQSGEKITSAENGKSAKVKLSLYEGSDRTALPIVSPEDFTNFYLIASKSDEADSQLMFGPWKTASEMRNDTIELLPGEYTFSLFGVCKNLLYEGYTKTLVNFGTSKIFFRMNYIEEIRTATGKGSVEIRIDYPEKELIRAVTVQLIKLGSKIDLSGKESDLTFGDGRVEYREDNVPAGNYVAKFNFYLDEAKKILRGSRNEYVVVTQDLVSHSRLNIETFSNVYSIRYVLNECGNFASGTEVPVEYTNLSFLITLPEPIPISDKFTFYGWYDNEKFSGSPIKSFSGIDSESKTLYAKWHLNKTVIYDANGGYFGDEQSKTQISEIERVDNPILKDWKDLGLKQPAGSTSFIGWALDKDAKVIDCRPNEEFILTDDKTVLYAVYSVVPHPQPGDPTDSDGDGLSDYDEINTYHSDPLSKDTDGDGWDDAAEIELGKNNPKGIFNSNIADIPIISVTMDENVKPVFGYIYEDSEGTSQSQDLTSSSTESFGTVNSTSHSQSSNIEHGWSFGIKGGISGKDGMFEVGGGYNGSYGSSTSASFSTDLSSSWSKTISKSQCYTETETRTIKGGYFTVALKIKNDGNIAYTVNSLSLGLNRVAANSTGMTSVVPVGPFPTIKDSFVLQPGDTVDLLATKSDLVPSDVDDLAHSAGINVIVSGYSLTSAYGTYPVDFTENYTKVLAKCAHLSIDYGTGSDKKTEFYLVNASKYNQDATEKEDEYKTITLKQMLEAAGISDSGDDPQLVLDGKKIKSIRGVESKGTRKDGDWYIAYQHTEVNKTVSKLYNDYIEDSETKDYDLNDIIITPSDFVHIFYDLDGDEDGVPRTEEKLYGTDDSNPDTDGDGKTDFDEIYGFTTTEGGDTRFVTNPLIPDTDGDGLNDNEDPDPLTPDSATEVKLSSFSYGTDISNMTDVDDFSTVYTDDLYEVSGTYGDQMVLKFSPAYFGTELSWCLKDGDKEPEDTDYQSLQRNTNIAFAPKHGENLLYVKLTAPTDETITSVYKFKITSDYNALSNYSITSSQSGKATVSYDSYSDTRFTGYILHGKTGDSYSSVTLTMDNIKQAIDIGAEDLPDEFYVNVSADDMKTCAFAVSGLGLRKNCGMGIYGYEIDGKGNLSTKCLGSGSVTMALPTEGTLRLYAYYIHDDEDCDEGSDPDYYWNITSNLWSDVKDKLSVAAKSLSSDFDDDDAQYYSFETGSVTNTEYKNGTVYFDVKMSRTEDHSDYKIDFHGYEYDYCSPDDDLGGGSKTFSYSHSNDTWYINKKDDGTSEASFTTGDSKKECTISLSSDDGKITFRFAVEWLRG